MPCGRYSLSTMLCGLCWHRIDGRGSGGISWISPLWFFLSCVHSDYCDWSHCLACAGSALHGRITAYTVASVSLLVFVGALAILDAERGVDGASIHSFENALWWTIVTITTAGYGDLSPVTPMDRFVAVLLMIGGVALIGVVTATLASWVVGLVAEETAEQEAATRAQVAELQAQIAGIEEMRLQALTARSQGQVQNGHELLATTGTLTPETAPERSPETSTG